MALTLLSMLPEPPEPSMKGAFRFPVKSPSVAEAPTLFVVVGERLPPHAA